MYVVNKLINMYAVCGNVRDARRVFDESPVRENGIEIGEAKESFYIKYMNILHLPSFHWHKIIYDIINEGDKEKKFMKLYVGDEQYLDQNLVLFIK